MSANQARLLLGTEHPCSYLPARTSRSLFVDPGLNLDAGSYGKLLGLGFRRSGRYVYRPACRRCQECRSARVLVAQFQPDRSQRRCLARNADLRLHVGTTVSDEHFALYRQYLSSRHPQGGMDPDDRETFDSFVTPAWGQTELLEWRDRAGRLLAGAVTDRLPHGLSAVYTWFDPSCPQRGLGTFAVLQQVARARQLALPHLYLGFWVAGSQTMDYKRRFQPLELLTDQGWRRGH